MAIRNLVDEISPTPSRTGFFERYKYLLGLAMDVQLEKLTQAIHARMPTKADPSALPFIGQDRLIPRGLTETDASYRTRLQEAYETWQLAGNPWSLLRQVLAFVLTPAGASQAASPGRPRVRTVATPYDTSTNPPTFPMSLWNSYYAADIVTKPPEFLREESAGTGNWDWDSLSLVSPDITWGWWRWWLVIFAVSPNDWIHIAPKWGSGTKWGAGTAWGVDQPASVGQSIRQIVGLWQREGSWCHEIIVSFDASLFDPTHAAGGGVNPDGYYGRWSKVVAGQYVPARAANARYGEGIA